MKHQQLAGNGGECWRGSRVCEGGNRDEAVSGGQREAEEDQVCSRTGAEGRNRGWRCLAGRKFRLTDFAFGNKDFFFKVLAPEIPGSHDNWEERHYSENQRPDSAFEVSVRAESAESQQSPPGFQSCLAPLYSSAQRHLAGVFGLLLATICQKSKQHRGDIRTLGEAGTQQAPTGSGLNSELLGSLQAA